VPDRKFLPVTTRSLPFDSRHLRNFHVVEERVGNVRRFPHTDQLPKLLEALNREFRDGLPDKIARVDRRGTDFMMLVKYIAAVAFSSIKNEARKDCLHLLPIFDQNKVARISIVQKTTAHTEFGPQHSFKFFGGADLFQETYLNGRRVSFAGHVLERFSERTVNAPGTDLTNFLCLFFGAPATIMECNNSLAFMFCHENAVAAFPVRLSDTAYFFPTVLMSDQIHDLKIVPPPIAYTHAYAFDHVMPDVRNWNPLIQQANLRKMWETKQPIRGRGPSPWASVRWSEFGHRIMDYVKTQGHGEESHIAFFDNVPGLNIIQLMPGQVATEFDPVRELECKFPNQAWQKILSESKEAIPDWFSNPNIDSGL
jgi:hypothetical protein